MFILITLDPNILIYCMSWDNAGISKYVFGPIFQYGETFVFYFKSAAFIEKFDQQIQG